MSMLNLNCIQSVREGLERTREELRLQLRGVWHVTGSSAFSTVPENKRQSYRETLQAQEKHLVDRLWKMEGEAMRKRYDDSARGAFQMLMDDTAQKREFADGSYRSDPQNHGVWEVTFPDVRFIVYLAGYPDCMGQIREINDFESDHGSHGTCWTTNGQKGE